jgi:soluble P-type ATPase
MAFIGQNGGRNRTMIEIEIPGVGTLTFRNLVLDVNGTIARDGKLIDGVLERLNELRSRLDIHLVTADTHGSQEQIDQLLNLKAVRIPREHQAQAKADYIEKLGVKSVAAIGNGANDALMLERAALGIFVIGPEGSAVEAMLKAKVIAGSIREALDLLLFPKRITATLRR